MANGNSFQTLFNDFMIRVHGDDFTPVKPHGNVGDGGMDGHFVLNDTVYQCYGADNGHVLDITRVCRKMRNDFESRSPFATGIPVPPLSSRKEFFDVSWKTKMGRDG
jgi:hypothetical protein